jgi:hypothetical protein
LACGALIFGWRFRRLNPAAPGSGAVTAAIHTERSGRAVPEPKRPAKESTSHDLE